MRKFGFLLIFIMSLCSLNATTSLDRDFYVKTGLQLDAIKRALTGFDTSSATYNTYVTVDSINFGFSEYVNLQTPFDRQVSLYTQTFMKVSESLPVFLCIDSIGFTFGNVHHLADTFGAFYNLVGDFSYPNLADIPYPYKQILAVMGIDTQKECELYFAAWYTMLWHWTSNSMPYPCVPSYNYPLNSVSLWSHIDEIAVYTALCCAKFNSYHLYFPSMGDFGNE